MATITVPQPFGAPPRTVELVHTIQDGRAVYRDRWQRARGFVPESDAVLEWNERRRHLIHGIRAAHRAWLPVEERVKRYSDDPTNLRPEIRLHTDEQIAPGSDDH